MNFLSNAKIVGVDVYLEKRKTRQYVGELSFNPKSKIYTFSYSEKYLSLDQIIPVGPELPLTQKTHQSKKLFPSFLDRIPSKENPAYRDYCYAMGISVNESNPLILLPSIGKRGPSSLVFEAHYERTFDGRALRNFRKDLGLTTREFASCFEITQSALVNIEKGKFSRNEILKRIEIYFLFPEVAIFQFKLHGRGLHIEKQKSVLAILQKRIKENKEDIN